MDNLFGQVVNSSVANKQKGLNTFVDDFIYMCYSLNLKNVKYGIFEKHIHVWVDGEIYSETQPDNYIYNAYKKHGSLSFLEFTDGCFYVVVYDSLAGKVYIATDRYGLKYIYWTIIEGKLVWSKSLQGFIDVKGFCIKVDEQSLSEFLSIGYMLGNKTWFKNVNLLSPASVLSFDLNSKRLTLEKYWWWNKIGRIGKVEEKNIVDKIGSLLTEAVGLRINKNERLGLTLSGGLDSRAIFAAFPSDRKIHAFNVRKNENDLDYKIAEKVVRKNKKAVLFYEEIQKDSWIQDRIEYISKCDGHFSIRHMHIVSPELYNTYADVNIHGFLGDLVLGGGFIKGTTEAFSRNEVVQTLHIPPHILKENDIAEYEGLNSNEYFYILNRGRRFAHAGAVILDNSYKHRFPFLDYKLIDYIYALPQEVRRDNHIYKKVLLNFFPEYFKEIAWQKTGLPISAPSYLIKIASFYRRVENKYQRTIGLSDKYCFTSYSEWIRLNKNIEFISEVLLDNNSVISNYYAKQNIEKCITEHLNGKDRTDRICTLLTFELYMNKVLNRGLF